MTTQLAFAYGLGMLALINPCGFMMLPAFVAYNISNGEAPDQRSVRRLGRGVGAGLAVSLGFVGTFAVGGLLVALGLRSLTEAVPWFSVVIGAGLVVLGLAMVAGRRVGLSIGRRFMPQSTPGRGRMVGFGGAYALTQLACGMGSLLALVGSGMAANSSVGTTTVFVAFGLGSTTMLLLLAVSSALMSDVLARSIRGLLPAVGRVSGVVLAATGAYLVVYWSPALFGGGAADNWVSRVVHDLSRSSRDWVRDNELTVTVLVVVVVALSVIAVRRTRSGVDATPDDQDQRNADALSR